jgi:collagen type IV alpha
VDGLPCKEDGRIPTGHMLVRHSQSSSIPLCGPGELKLWDGYSLLYVEGNEKSHHQDLGKIISKNKINVLNYYY